MLKDWPFIHKHRAGSKCRLAWWLNLQNYCKTHKQTEHTSNKPTTGNIIETRESAVERSRILSWSWRNKSETKTKQKTFSKTKSRAQKKASNDECATTSAASVGSEGDDRAVPFDFHQPSSRTALCNKVKYN